MVHSREARDLSISRKLRQLRKLSEVAPQPGFVSAARTWKPFSLTSFGVARSLREYGPSFRTIIDGGANAGQFARAAHETFPAARVYCFEPLPNLAAQLRETFNDDSRVSVHCGALASEAGKLTFFQHAYSHMSSILRPLGGGGATTPGEVTEIEVEAMVLDEVLDVDSLESPILLKLDLQGAEIDALHGATSLLKRVDQVLVETSFKASYEGEPLFHQVLELLEGRGFRFVMPIDVYRDDEGVVVQMDALFERASS